MVVIVDTDTLLGLFNPVDLMAEKAIGLAEKLADAEAEFVILPTTMSEFALLASSRVGKERTNEALGKMREMTYRVIEIDTKLVDAALRYYREQTSKEESLFDCFVMAAASRLKVDCIFSFDHGYKKNGFKLASDVV